MVNFPETYVIAVPRELRNYVAADWQARIRELGGIAVNPSPSPHRMQIEADAAVLGRIEAEFGSVLRIEPRSMRNPAAG